MKGSKLGHHYGYPHPISECQLPIWLPVNALWEGADDGLKSQSPATHMGDPWAF